MGYGTLDPNFKINNTRIYSPTEGGVQIDHDNIVSSDSGRMESGKMHIRWVRRDVIKVSMTWDKLTGNEVNYLKNLMQGKEFTFHYYDNGEKTIQGYCGKITYTLFSAKKKQSEGGTYKNVQANVVEM